MTFKGIISYGPDTTPSYLEAQATFDNVLAAPLDGVVVECFTNSGVQLSIDCWNPTTVYTIDDLSESVAALAARRKAEAQSNFNQTFGINQVPAPNGFGKCDKNFVKLQIASQSSTPTAVIDPFSSDFEGVYQKLRLIGQFAAQAGFYGIWFDVEGYIPIWIYTQQPLKDTHTFEEYQQRWHDIGEALATDWLNYNHNLSVIVTSAYDGYAGRGPPYETNEFGLYKNFLDGFLDGWGFHYYNVYPGSGKIILTTEGTYGLTDTGNLVRYGVRQMNGTFDSYVHPVLPPSLAGIPPPDTNYWGSSVYFYDDNVREIGLALWIDKPSFNPATPNSNYWTPTVFQSALETVMDNCQWCWIYQEQYQFYNGVAGAIPAAYITKINEARIYAGLPNF